MVDAPPDSKSFVNVPRPTDASAAGGAGAFTSHDDPPAKGELPCGRAPPTKGAPPSQGVPPAKGGRAAAKAQPSRDELLASERPARELLDRRQYREALAWLVRAYKAHLYAYCYRLAKKNDAFANDVLQDTFLLALKALPDVQPNSCLRTWLRTIAFRRLVDLMRAATVRLGSAPEADPDELPASEQGPEEWLDLQVASRELDDALAELSPEEQHAIALRHEEGLSYEEMSRLLGEKAGTLQARVARAKKELRRRLEKKKVTL
jgi:RNA polymerase sigma factor (sigma-70 family)